MSLVSAVARSTFRNTAAFRLGLLTWIVLTVMSPGSLAMAAEVTDRAFPAVPAVIIFLLGIGAGAAAAYYVAGRAARKQVVYTLDEQKVFAATVQIGLWIGAFAVIGTVATVIACLGVSAATGPAFGSLYGADVLVGAAAAGIGALLGFIFGIPRTISAVGSAGATQGDALAVSKASLGANTNLERVSDWLTTLLIGATLVQIKDIAVWIGGLGGTLVSGAITNEKIVPFIAVYYFALGFLGVYLITRLYLTTALEQTLVSGDGVSDLTVLRAKLRNALATSDPVELAGAMSFLNQWPLAYGQRADPSLNADLARVIAKYLGSGKAENVPAVLDQLRAALKNASTDPALKIQLRADFGSGTVTTGDKGQDADIARLLA